jgi:hypothetical protein
MENGELVRSSRRQSDPVVAHYLAAEPGSRGFGPVRFGPSVVAAARARMACTRQASRLLLPVIPVTADAAAAAGRAVPAHPGGECHTKRALPWPAGVIEYLPG